MLASTETSGGPHARVSPFRTRPVPFASTGTGCGRRSRSQWLGGACRRRARTGHPGDEVKRVRAFTFPDTDRTAIYVNTDDPLWTHAKSGVGHEFYRAVLASVVAHEAWHLAHGASENGALREELRLWQTFIARKLVPTAEGLQHAVVVERDIRTARTRELQASAAANIHAPVP
jgi:hypothetical protein